MQTRLAVLLVAAVVVVVLTAGCPTKNARTPFIHVEVPPMAAEKGPAEAPAAQTLAKGEVLFSDNLGDVIRNTVVDEAAILNKDKTTNVWCHYEVLIPGGIASNITVIPPSKMSSDAYHNYTGTVTYLVSWLRPAHAVPVNTTLVETSPSPISYTRNEFSIMVFRSPTIAWQFNTKLPTD